MSTIKNDSVGTVAFNLKLNCSICLLLIALVVTVFSQQCNKEIQRRRRVRHSDTWPAFLKRPENFSGPKAFRGFFG